MTIQEIQDELIEEFELFDDWEGKYEYIIDLGKKLLPLSDTYKTDENIIKGCQSRVWLKSDFQNDTLIFTADSDAIIVKGLVSMLVRILSGQKPQDIIDSELYFLERIGLHQHLAQTRSNGLASMVKQMKLDAIAFAQS
jgi:cysteine desulfuration protein SufE